MHLTAGTTKLTPVLRATLFLILPPTRILACLRTSSRSKFTDVRLPASRYSYRPTAIRVRFWCCCGPHAGSWLGAIPTCGWLTAQSTHYLRALQLRFSIPLRELASGTVRCPCDVLLDPWGFHYGVCERGNRGGAWSWRHDILEAGLIATVRALHVRACRITSNHLGEAAVTDPARGN